MTIKAILACDQNGGIGKDNILPWPRNSADMRHFKNLTKDNVIVMGYNTWEGLSPKPLKDRVNVVATQNNRHKIIGADHIIGENLVLDIYRLNYLYSHKDIWIIGGAKLLESLLHVISEIHLTRIPGYYDCDTFIDLNTINSKFKLESFSENLENTRFEVWTANK